MNRRRFLRLLGGVAAGSAGVAAGRSFPGGTEVARADAWDRDAATGRSPRTALGSRRLVWSVETDEPVVALTFDDGPNPSFTERVLEVLEAHGAKATFNLMGVNAQSYPDTVRETLRRGHELGNHTLSHFRLSSQTPAETRDEILRAKEVIEDVAGGPVRFFRPPWGELNGVATRSAAAAGHDILLWSATRRLPGVGTPDTVAENLLAQIEPGAVLLLHDGFRPGTFQKMTPDRGPMLRRRQVELAALPLFLEQATTRGFRFVTASELVDRAAVGG